MSYEDHLMTTDVGRPHVPEARSLTWAEAGWSDRILLLLTYVNLIEIK